ncbi:MAG: hypothetical protein AB1Z31_23000 [Desulfobacterales bacterium]
MRVKYHGLGVVADKDTDGEEQIERNIERTMSDPDIRRNVAAMRDRFHEYEQPDRAVELVESYIGRRLLAMKVLRSLQPKTKYPVW